MDIKKYRATECPWVDHVIFLNHAGVSPISGSGIKALDKYLKDMKSWAAFHSKKWDEHAEVVRALAAKLVNASIEEIAFAKNTSEGLSFVAEGLEFKAGDEIVTYAQEYPSNVYPWQYLEETRGVKLKFVRKRGARILVEDIERLFTKRTKLLAISSVEFSDGFRNDLKSLGKLCRDRGALFCVDAIQSLGMLPMDVKKFNIDFLAADAHKWLMGPEGIGIFYASERVWDLVRPFEVGWKSIVNQDDYDNYDFTLKKSALKFEPGSLNTIGIYALGGSLEMLLDIGLKSIEKRLLHLTQFLIKGLKREGYTVVSSTKPSDRSGIVSFTGSEPAESIVDRLKKKKIHVAGRAGAVRVSPHFYNTEEELEIMLKELSG